MNLGLLSLLRGDADQALEHLHKSRALASDLGDPAAIVRAALQIAEVELQLDDPTRAEEAIEDATAAASRSADPRDGLRTAVMRGRLHLERGEPRDAAKHLVPARTQLLQLGALAEALDAQLRLGIAEAMIGEHARAVRTISSVIDEAVVLELPELQAEALSELALVHQLTGDTDARRSALERGLSLARASTAPALKRRLETDYALALVGERIVASGLADMAAVTQAIETSRRKGLGLGRHLLAAGLLQRNDFEALLAQMGVRRLERAEPRPRGA